MNIFTIESAALIIIIFVLLFVIAKYKIDDYRKKRAQKKRFQRAAEFEIRAKHFLEKKGFKIIGNQEVYYHKYEVNGVLKQSKLILDYVVSKDRNTYIVEVKSGKSAISINDKNTRRQLLEYDFVIENDGVFLLDMENEKLNLIKFHSKKERADRNLNLVLIMVALIGILIPFWSVKTITIMLLFAVWRFPKIVQKIVL